MKKIVIMMVAVCAVLAHGATKVATQDWVKRYVGNGSAAQSLVRVETNSIKSVNYSMSANDDPALAEVVGAGGSASIMAHQCTNLIFKAVESNVAGVPSGTVWRVMGLYLNSSNEVLPQLKVRAWVEGDSKQWRLFGTNTQTRAEFSSMRDGGYWYLTAKGTPSQRIKLATAKVNNEEARRAYMADIARSRMREMFDGVRSVFISSVYAAWLDPLPSDPLAYDWYQFCQDADSSCDVFYVGSIELTSIVNDDLITYTASFENLPGFDGHFKLDLSTLYADGSNRYTKEDFSNSQNWNIPFDEKSNHQLDTIYLRGDDGQIKTLTRRALEKTEIWKLFSLTMYEYYITRMDALMQKHECFANPDDECRCEMFDSIHCASGRGQGTFAKINASPEVVKENAIKLHDFEIINGCKVCRNQPDGSHDTHIAGNGCKCACGAVVIAHKFSDPTQCACDCNETYRHVAIDDNHCKCQCRQTVITHVPHASMCGCECREYDGGTEANFHKRKYNDCGCQCGTFDKNDKKKTKDEYWHPHPLKDNSEEEHCNCYCGRDDQHKFEKSELCPKVCGDCRVLNKDGNTATEEDHREKDESRAANYEGGVISSCGCECGHFLAGDVAAIERFHYQKTGSCKCLGANGQGGEWHFPCPDDNCPGVCRYDHEGQKMRVANPLNDSKAERLFELATIENHAAATDHCGCKCGEYTGREPEAANSAMHHANNDTCGCECGSKNDSMDIQWHKNETDHCGCKCGKLIPQSLGIEWHKFIKMGCEFCECYRFATHVNKTNDCGCVCGEMDASSDKRWHPHPSKEGSSEKHCNCYCEDVNQHEFEESNLCPEVCGDCRLLTRSKIPAGSEQHRAMDSSRLNYYPGHSISRCGCECGKMLASDGSIKYMARFHYRKPGSCMCLGGDGNGGEWHFPNPDGDCKGVCATDHSDGKKRVAKPEQGEKCERGIYDATLSDHEASTYSCGCKCGYYSKFNSNVPASMHKDKSYNCGCECGEKVPKPHKYLSSTDCRCECGEIHRANRMSLCPKICNGCNRVFLNGADNVPYTTSINVEMKHHDVDETRCACKCGKYSSALNNLSGEAFNMFHHCQGDDCWCICQKRHLNPIIPSGTCRFCTKCDYAENDFSKQNNDRKSNVYASTHEKKNKDCQCLCGVQSYGTVCGHDFRTDECVCDCGNTRRPHVWVSGTPYSIGGEVCSRCYGYITYMEAIDTCSRCGECSDAINWEEGHAANCGWVEEHHTPTEPSKCGCGCSLCDCSACSVGRGTCSTCGNACGNGDGGTGGGENSGEGGTGGGDLPIDV